MYPKNSIILITGGAGFLGTQVVKLLSKRGYRNLVIPRSKEYDLRNPANCRTLTSKADIVIHLAANVGGIGYNQKFPADLFYDNLLMGINMLHYACYHQVKKFVAVGTVCAYPKYTEVPFSEENLWNGYPEETNAPYGLAKKMLLVGCHAYRQQYNFNGIYLIPVNLYGPRDNFQPQRSHVIPALISKFFAAKKKKKQTVTVWGTGSASREFLYVEDAAEAIVAAMERYEKPEPVNIGSGQEITIRDLVRKIAQLVNFRGKIIWDKTKPDGQPRRFLNTERAFKEFGFRAKTDLDVGLKKTIRWYKRFHG